MNKCGKSAEIKVVSLISISIGSSFFKCNLYPYLSPIGKIYYFNRETKETSWTVPDDLVVSQVDEDYPVPSPVTSPNGTIRKGKSFIVLYDFEGDSSQNQLPIKTGDIVYIIQELESGWSGGKNSLGQVGYFPTNFLEEIEEEDELLNEMNNFNEDLIEPNPLFNKVDELNEESLRNERLERETLLSKIEEKLTNVMEDLHRPSINLKEEEKEVKEPSIEKRISSIRLSRKIIEEIKLNENRIASSESLRKFKEATSNVEDINFSLFDEISKLMQDFESALIKNDDGGDTLFR